MRLTFWKGRGGGGKDALLPYLLLIYLLLLDRLYNTYIDPKKGKGEKTVKTEVANRDQKKKNWDLFFFFLRDYLVLPFPSHGHLEGKK